MTQPISIENNEEFTVFTFKRGKITYMVPPIEYESALLCENAPALSQFLSSSPQFCKRYIDMPIDKHDGITSLILVISRQSWAAAALLLDYGASPFAAAANGATPRSALTPFENIPFQDISHDASKVAFAIMNARLR